MPTANSPAIQTALCTAPPLLGTLDTPLALGTSGSAVATLSGFILSPAFPHPGDLREISANRPKQKPSPQVTELRPPRKRERTTSQPGEYLNQARANTGIPQGKRSRGVTLQAYSGPRAL